MSLSPKILPLAISNPGGNSKVLARVLYDRKIKMAIWPNCFLISKSMIILLIFVAMYFTNGSLAYAKSADDYIREANYDLSHGNNDQAILDCTNAIKISPKNYLAFHLRGASYLAEENRTLAISDFTKAIEINPKDVSSYLSRAFVYLQEHDFLHAISDCTKALEVNPPLSPQNIGIYQTRGIIYMEQGNFPKAILDFTKLIELMPHYEETALYDRSQAYEANHDYDLAVNDLTRIIEIDAQFISRQKSYYTRYHHQLNLSNYQNTINYYSKEIKLNPKNAIAYYGRGLFHAVMNENSQAITDLSKAIELNPKYGEAYYARGIAYYYDYSNQSKKAKTDMQSAEKLGIVPDPNFIKTLNDATY